MVVTLSAGLVGMLRDGTFACAYFCGVFGYGGGPFCTEAEAVFASVVLRCILSARCRIETSRRGFMNNIYIDSRDTVLPMYQYLSCSYDL